MQVIVRQARRFFRRLPASVRHHSLTQSFKDALLARMSHDQVYDHDYYDHVEEWARKSSDSIADSIVSTFAPSSVIDVGCGTGALLEALSARGVSIQGLEYSEEGIERCLSRGVKVEKFDIERDKYHSQERFGIAISMEVAEHLPELVADRYVDLLTSLSDIVVITAAPPGQLGTDHVNLQPKSYWIAKFAERRFAFDQINTEHWARDWVTQGDVVDFYHRNLLIFRADT